MRNLFRDQQILAIIIGGVGATMITAWIMNPQSGPAGWIKVLSPATQSFLSGAVIVLVFGSIALLVSIAASSYARTGALQPAQHDGLAGSFRMLFAPARVIPDSLPDKAIEDLEAMVGLAPVKREVNGLIARIQVELNFPPYGPDDLCEILRRLATRQHFSLPDDFAGALTPWIETHANAPDWGNARSMRTLLEKAREAQAIRISTDASADLSRIETADLLEATVS
jgi:hypothetical protein